MATIQKRTAKDGSTSYRVMVRLRGVPAQYATFHRKTDAKKWAQKTEVAIREGRLLKNVEAQRRTVAELLDRYEEEVLSEKPGRKQRDQLRHLQWWRRRLGNCVLADLTPSILVAERTRLSRGLTVRGRRRSPGTVNRYLTSVGHAFSVAHREWGWLEANPMRRVRKLKEPRGRVRFLSDEERRRLLSVCQASSDRRLYPLVVLALSTGARRGELLGLTWADIDLARGVAILHRTKNDERRALPIAGLAAELLAGLAGEVSAEGPVFGNAEGRAVFPRWSWVRALEAAGIEDFRFHDLRHSAASYLAMSGATLSEIAEILGHKTLAMVKRYSHLTEQHTAAVVARMNETIFS